jgi:hypothetical protein
MKRFDKLDEARAFAIARTTECQYCAHPYTTVANIPAKLRYMRIPYERPALHYGQLKLFLSEVSFLTHCGACDRASFVVYAGSAPGNTRHVLARMFPRSKFLLVDPHPHQISPSMRCLYFDVALVNSRRAAQTVHSRDPNTPRIATFVDFMCADGIIRTQARENNVAPEWKIKNARDIANAIVAHISEYDFFIIENLFTDEIAHSIAQLGPRVASDVLFISDIRTRLHEGIYDEDDESVSPSDLDIIANNAMQHIWVDIIQPRGCMLKFRTPYMNTPDRALVAQHSSEFKELFAQYEARFHVDIIARYLEGTYYYLCAHHIDLQSFPGSSSTETRLIARENYGATCEYVPRDHEEKLAYYNLARECTFCDRYRDYFGAIPGFDGCLDCTLAMFILEQWASIQNESRFASQCESAFDILRQLTTDLARPLLTGQHGNFTRAFINVRQISASLRYNVKHT